MTVLIILSVTAAVIIALWLYMIKPGKKHSLNNLMRRFNYAHRGLHDDKKNIPENSMSAFRLAKMRGYGIELDLHLSASGTPVVIHDSSLARTAGVNVPITDIKDSDIKKYRLENTSEAIPFFYEVLEEVAGSVPLLIELKVDHGNYARLCDRTMEALEGYNGLYAVQSFDPRAVKYLRQKYPKVMRGQLAGYLRRSGDKLHPFLDFGLRNLLSNFLTKPNFIAYRVQDTATLSVSLCRWLYHPSEFNWTIRKRKQYKRAKRNGAIAIFENIIP